jgi:hypothetical protein
MGSYLKVAGLDPSMKNFGMVRGELDLDSGLFYPVDVGLLETSPTKVKTVRKNSDDLFRANALYEGMSDFIKDVSLVFVEVPHGSQSARAMASYGMCIGILASITKSFIQVSALQVKLAACNNKKATKDDMIKWATTTYPNLKYFTRKLKGEVVMTAKNEHIADAIASVHAGVATNEFKNLLSIYRSQQIGTK